VQTSVPDSKTPLHQTPALVAVVVQTSVPDSKTPLHQTPAVVVVVGQVVSPARNCPPHQTPAVELPQTAGWFEHHDPALALPLQSPG